MGNLLSLNPKIHSLNADAKVCRSVPDADQQFDIGERGLRHGNRRGISMMHAPFYDSLYFPQTEFGQEGQCPDKLRNVPTPRSEGRLFEATLF